MTRGALPSPPCPVPPRDPADPSKPQPITTELLTKVLARSYYEVGWGSALCCHALALVPPRSASPRSAPHTPPFPLDPPPPRPPPRPSPFPPPPFPLTPLPFAPPLLLAPSRPPLYPLTPLGLCCIGSGVLPQLPQKPRGQVQHQIRGQLPGLPWM